MSNSVEVETAVKLMDGTGEMRALVRAFDWASTPLGPIHDWPECLRTAVDIVLGSSFPMILVWGPQLIQIYNDSYIPLIGAKHPRALGLPTHACWPEIRHVQEPTFRRVFNGETVQLSAAHYALDRHDTGELDDAYFDASFIPVPLPGGEVCGSLSILFESTHRVRAAVMQEERELLRRTAEEAEQAEREASAQLRVALEAAELGTWSFDLGTGKAWHSARTNALFGRPAVPGPVTLDEFFSCLVEDDRPRVRIALDDAACGNGSFDIEYRVAHPDGRVLHIGALGHVLQVSDDAPARLMGIAQDVTERKIAEADRERVYQRELAAHAEVEQAYRDVAAANHAKSEFLAVMSHELRTPLNAIGGYVELLELGIRGPVTREQLVDLTRIKAAQRHLVGLVTDVLDLVRIDSGQLQYTLTAVRLADVMASVEVLIAPQLRAKQILLSSTRPDTSLYVHADREKLAQILVNLLANAVKFTQQEGRVSVEYELNETMVSIHVRDTGIGIAPEKLQAIFEPFVQLDHRLTRTTDGVGLGLAISRDLARGMGATLTVESTLGVGSTFTLTLPRIVR